jgi:hypothetical protein
VAALVDLQGEIASLHSTMKKILRVEEEYQQKGPTLVNLQGSGTVDSNSDPLVIDLGGPNQNRVWEVRQLIAGGLTWATTVAGNGLIVISSAPPTAPYGLVAMQDHIAAFPAVAFYSGGQFRLRAPTHVYLVILSGTASTPYQVAGDAYDMPDIGGRAVFTA